MSRLPCQASYRRRSGDELEPVGYCTPLSVLPGEPVALHASGAAGIVNVEVVRDGAVPEVVWRADGLPLPNAQVPDDAPEQGCGWDVCTTIPIGADWRGGMYVVRFRGDDRPSAWFVVRAPRPSRDRTLLVLATNTWNAYNDFGGRNLYTGAVELSFERPLAAGLLAKPSGPWERVVEGRAYAEYTRVNALSLWHGMSGWAGQERRFALWAETKGIALDYAISADLEHEPDLLDGYSVYVSVGHDEYWTWGMRDAVESFVEAGGRAAFLSGNTCYWQVRLEGHAMVCYKHRFVEDPVHGTADARLTTTMWSDPLTNRPETTMTGLSFTRGGYARTARSVPRGSGGYEIHRPDHWLLAGTRLRRGDVLGSPDVVVGYECDGCDLTLVDGLPAERHRHSRSWRARRPLRSIGTPRHCRWRPAATTSSSSTPGGCSATTHQRTVSASGTATRCWAPIHAWARSSRWDAPSGPTGSRTPTSRK